MNIQWLFLILKNECKEERCYKGTTMSGKQPQQLANSFSYSLLSRGRFFLNKNQHLCFFAISSISFFVHHIGDCTKQPFNACAGRTKVFAGCTNKTRETGLVGLPVFQWTVFPGNCGFMQVFADLQKKKHLGATFLIWP